MPEDINSVPGMTYHMTDHMTDQTDQTHPNLRILFVIGVKIICMRVP